MLFIFGGLPAVGKSELASYFAKKMSAAYLRIDSIEQAMRDGDFHLAGPEGYMVAYALAKDNLGIGTNVVADSVNPIEITRCAWRSIAQGMGAAYCEIEIVCSDKKEHQRRVETRGSDIPGLRLPRWEDVLERDYEKWESADIVIDTAGKSPDESKSQFESMLNKLYPELAF